MRKITKKTAVIIAGSSLLVAVGGGVAFAYWTSTGSGTGSASTAPSATTSSLAVAQTNAPSGLAPGVAPVGITGTITNGGTNSVYVNTLTVTITGVDTAHATGCSAADYGLTTSGSTALVKGSIDAPQTVQLTVAKDLAPTASVSFPAVNIGFADNATADQSGCEGATPQLTFTTN